MILNRRRLLISAPAAIAIPGIHAMSAQSQITSGGLGLTVADIQAMYEELPVGQSFRNFADPETGAAMYIDFGEEDFAQNIWIEGELGEAEANDLITWLCPDDIQAMQTYEILTGAGSLATQKCLVLHSEFLGEIGDGRSGVISSYVVEPGPGADPDRVSNVWLSIEQGNGRG